MGGGGTVYMKSSFPKRVRSILEISDKTMILFNSPCSQGCWKKKKNFTKTVFDITPFGINSLRL